MPKEIVLPLILGVLSPHEGRSDLILRGPEDTPFKGCYRIIASNPLPTRFYVDPFMHDWLTPFLHDWVSPFKKFSGGAILAIEEDITGTLLLWTSARYQSDIYKELLSTGSFTNRDILPNRCLKTNFDEVVYIFK